MISILPHISTSYEFIHTFVYLWPQKPTSKWDDDDDNKVKWKCNVCIYVRACVWLEKEQIFMLKCKHGKHIDGDARRDVGICFMSKGKK